MLLCKFFINIMEKQRLDPETIDYTLNNKFFVLFY